MRLLGRFLRLKPGTLGIVTLLGATLVGTASLVIGCSAGEQYPSKPILFVVPYSPGGGSDIMVRNFDKIGQSTKAFPQPFAIENKTGGSGVVGKSYVKEKTPDGYSLVVVDESNAYADLLAQAPWKYNEFTFVARLVQDYNMVVVRADSPYKTLKDLADAAKAKPKQISFGGTGVANADQIHLAVFSKAGGGEYNYIAFDSGGQVITNLLGGQIEAAMANPSEAYEQMRAGKVRALGISSPQRTAFDPVFKDVPTWKEAGFDATIAQWRGIAGPPGMKKEQADWLSAAIKKTTDAPEWKSEYLDKFQQVNAFIAGDDFKKFVDEDYAIDKALFPSLGLTK